MADLVDNVRSSLPQRIYRIVGIGPDGQRTVLASGLPEPEALQQRARMFNDARFARLVVERDREN
jgi:hypothetical protein